MADNPGMGKARRMPFFEVVHGPSGKGGPVIPLSKGSVGPVKAPPPVVVPAQSPAPSPQSSAAPSAVPVGRRDAYSQIAPSRPATAGLSSRGSSGAALPDRDPLEAETDAGTPHHDGSVDETPNRDSTGGKVLVVSMNTVLIAAAIVLAAIAGVWSIGYMSGQSSEREKLPSNSAFSDGNTPVAPPITDPLNEAGGAATAGSGGASSRGMPQLPQGAIANTEAPINQNITQSGGAATDGTEGVLRSDPRQVGFNYLELTVLRYEDAVEAIQYLTANGLPVAAVPTNGVDPKTAAAKNLNCLLFVLEGIPSQGYKSEPNVRRRSEIEGQVRRLGKAFQKDKKGASDFAEPLWRRK